MKNEKYTELFIANINSSNCNINYQSLITENHLISMMIYCNFNKIEMNLF